MISEQCRSTDDRVIIMGDINARMPNLNVFIPGGNSVSYSQNPDPRSNSNGTMLTSLCQDVGLLPVNHLTTADIACDGGLTYKQKNNWISQLDWALCSESAIDNIEEFGVIPSYELATNHAPIAIKLRNFHLDLDTLVQRSKSFGVVDRANKDQSGPVVPMHLIDPAIFKSELPPAND